MVTGSTCQSPWTRLVFRLQLRVLLQQEIAETTISSALGCDVKTVLMWKKRFLDGHGLLDRPRSGRPPTIPSQVQHRLLGFYCQHNPLPGCTRWTIRWAEVYLQKHKEILQCSISRSSIQRLLNLHSLKPYRNKYFLQICDPNFFPKMEKIIRVYNSAYKYLFCLDECTGLQALERKAPRLPAHGDYPEYIEPEYVRHGTVSILSILRVSNGQVFTQCIPDHTSSTIISCVNDHALQYDRSAQLHYICDNYSSHSTEEFCQGIAQLCRIGLPKLKTAEDRRHWLQSCEKRIVFHFLPTHGSWLNLIEIWFGILQQKAIKDESFFSTTDIENRILSYTDTWNTEFAHPFRFSYTGEGLHEKAVSRLTKWLQMKSPQLNPKFLGKQLRLMINLTKQYWSKTKKDAWKTLRVTLQQENDFIQSIIVSDEELNAQLVSLNNLLDTNLKAS